MDSLQCDSNTVTVATPTESTETTIRYLDAGDGPPVVLVHGIGLDAAGISWKHAIPELAETHRVIAPDLPGHGESDAPRVRYTTEYYIETLAAFLQALGIQRTSLVGISMGGGVALGYALDNPVDRLALVDSYGLGTDAAWRPMMTMGLSIPFIPEFFLQTMGLNEGTVRQTLSEYTSQPSEAFVAEIHERLGDSHTSRTLQSWQRSEFRATGFKTCYLDDLPELSVPTLLVHGAEDTLLPPSWSRRAAELLPRSELRILEDCGHWPPREHPGRFNSLLTQFLSTTRAASD